MVIVVARQRIDHHVMILLLGFVEEGCGVLAGVVDVSYVCAARRRRRRRRGYYKY